MSISRVIRIGRIHFRDFHMDTHESVANPEKGLKIAGRVVMKGKLSTRKTHGDSEERYSQCVGV